MEWSTFTVLIIVFLATLIRSTFGFGEALFAVPLLSFVIPLEIAVPLATLISITVALIVIVQDHDKIHLHSAKKLILSTLFGIPLGLYLLSEAPERPMKTILAIIIAGFALFCMTLRNKFHLKNDRSAWFFGWLAGILGGLYGMNGPPLVVFGSGRRWPPRYFRATLQSYFLPASLLGMLGYGLAGLWVAQVTHLYLVSLPITLVAIFLGRVINHRIGARTFTSLLHLALVIISFTLLFQAQQSTNLSSHSGHTLSTLFKLRRN